MPDTPWYAGLDLGGTSLRAAGVEDRGRLAHFTSAPVDHTPRPAFEQVIQAVQDLIQRRGGQPPRAIGLAVTGPVDITTGIITNPYTLPPSLNGDARTALHAAFGVPVVVENDANAAAVGEAWYGAGRGADVLACLTVGTGIGFAVIRDGTVQRGAAGDHLEGGHHVVALDGPHCYCGARGCVESLASGTAVLTAARAAGVVPPTATTARDVYARTARGDARAAAITGRATRALAAAVRNAVALHAADRVILTGGALGDPVAVLHDAQRALDTFTLGPRRKARVVLAELDDHAGCLGAARLAQGALADSSNRL